MLGLGAIGEFPIGGPPNPISGTWASTEAKDAFAAAGVPSAATGVWASTEPKDTFAAAGHPELAGVWSSAEAKDAFAAAGHPEINNIVGEWASIERPDCFTASGLSYDFGEPVYTETIEIFGRLLEAQRRLNNGDPNPHGGHAPPTCASPQHRSRQ